MTAEDLLSPGRHPGAEVPAKPGPAHAERGANARLAKWELVEEALYELGLTLDDPIIAKLARR
jgi:hypothetical protein